jgi:hypothetical protein
MARRAGQRLVGPFCNSETDCPRVALRYGLCAAHVAEFNKDGKIASVTS